MAVQSNLRRRPVGDEGHQGIPPRARVARRHGDPQDVIMAVLSELGAQLEAFVNELRLREMKSWGEFFAHFKAPRAWNTKVLDERLTTNFVHFRGNYSVVAAGLLVVGIVSHPSVLVALIGCALLWTFLFPTGEYPRVVKVGGHVLGQSERVAANVIGMACILGLWGAWYVLLFYGGLATLLCTVHAVFRPRTIASKASRVAANAQVAAGGFTIERAQSFVENIFGMNQDSSRSQ